MHRIAVVAVAGVLGFAGAARGQEPIPVTSVLLVNTHAPENQTQPAVGMGDDGTHVVVWSSEVQDDDGFSVRFRRFPGDGSAPNNEGPLNQVTAGNQQHPAIGMNASRNWVATWATFFPTVNHDIDGRRATNSGTTLHNQFEANEVEAGADSASDASVADDDQFVIVWQRGADVFMRRFDDFGDALAGEEPAVPGAAVSRAPKVAHLAGGRSVVSFDAEDGEDHLAYFQLVSSAGVPLGNPDAVDESDTGSHHSTDVAGEAGGGFVVGWKTDGEGLRLRRFNENGTPRGGEIAVGGNTGANEIEIAASPNGGFVVVFRDLQVMAREFDRLGRPVGAPFQVHPVTTDMLGAPAVAAGADRFVVVWHQQALNEDADVFRRIYRFRSVFADDFEVANASGWSSTSP